MNIKIFNIEKLKGSRDTDMVEFWIFFSNNDCLDTDQGKRNVGIVTNAMMGVDPDSMVFANRLVRTIKQLRERYLKDHTKDFLQIRYFNIAFKLPKSDFQLFFENPRAYALNKAYENLLDMGC